MRLNWSNMASPRSLNVESLSTNQKNSLLLRMTPGLTEMCKQAQMVEQ